MYVLVSSPATLPIIYTAQFRSYQFISLFSCISTLHALSYLSPFSLCRIFAVSVACPCSQSARGYDRKPRPASGTRRRWAPVPF